MKKICCRLPGGRVAVVCPDPGYVAELMESGMSEDQAVVAIGIKDAPAETISSFLCDQFPADRMFREAWEASAKTVGVNMPKARQIQMARIRAARDAKLDKIDLREAAPAMARGDQESLAEIEARKQRLRDLPATVDLDQHMTPEQLGAAWPNELAADA